MVVRTIYRVFGENPDGGLQIDFADINSIMENIKAIRNLCINEPVLNKITINVETIDINNIRAENRDDSI